MNTPTIKEFIERMRSVPPSTLLATFYDTTAVGYKDILAVREQLIQAGLNTEPDPVQINAATMQGWTREVDPILGPLWYSPDRRIAKHESELNFHTP